MRFQITAIGRMKAGPDSDMAARYVERANAAGRSVSLAPLEIVELPESRHTEVAARCTDEGERLIQASAAGDFRIALDETGKLVTSTEFANRIAHLRDGGYRHCIFLIGGADGLSPDVRARADMTLSLGRMTLPHQIARIVLCEQIYRAITILSGHPYHRG